MQTCALLAGIVFLSSYSATYQDQILNVSVGPEILHWEDRAAAWSGLPDETETKILMYDSRLKTEIRAAHGAAIFLDANAEKQVTLRSE